MSKKGVSFSETPNNQPATKKQKASLVNRQESENNLTSKEQKEMDAEYEQIADIDDLEITPWQRQMRVNKFMVEVRVRELISHMISPVYRN